ncbi:MAG TPA: hypothetical protein VKA21_09400 [Candidatus Binatia bacterium]|nr:hypothetical protein [Candidatus Binatia bacterium]
MRALPLAAVLLSLGVVAEAACPGTPGSSGPPEGCFECPPNPAGVAAPKSGCIIGGNYYDGSNASEVRINNPSTGADLVMTAPGPITLPRTSPTGPFAWIIDSGSPGSGLQILGCPVSCGTFDPKGSNNPIIAQCPPCP